MKRRKQPSEGKPHARSWLRNKPGQSFQGYPVAILAFYGPTDKLATKVAVSIILTDNNERDFLERGFPMASWMCVVIRLSASRSWPSSSLTLPALLWLPTASSAVPMKKALTIRTEPPVRSVLIGPAATASRTNEFSERWDFSMAITRPYCPRQGWATQASVEGKGEPPARGCPILTSRDLRR